jgi:hypothetical protein
MIFTIDGKMQPKINKPLKITQEYVNVNIYKLIKKNNLLLIYNNYIIFLIINIDYLCFI